MYLEIGVVVIVALIAWSFKGYNEVLDVSGKSVFISGCDTGFGHVLALRMDKLGMKVFAACLTEKGAEELKSKGSNNLQAIVCDITKEEDITKAAKIVASSSPEGLWALVNNAGIGILGEWDWLPQKYLRQIMEVNFFGHVNITKHFLPQIKKAKGRIVNVTSLAGYFTFNATGAYSCTKYAMEAFSDSLRLEMRKWGVSVFIVSPGPASTPIQGHLQQSVKRVWSEATEEQKIEYGEDYGTKLLDTPWLPEDSPEKVVDVLQSKIINKYPALRTRVGILAKVIYPLVTYLPTSWFDFLISSGIQPVLPAVLQKKKK